MATANPSYMGGGMSTSIKLRGLKEFTAKIDAKVDKMNMDIKRAVFALATEIGNESQDLVPVATGNLKASMDVTRPSSMGKNVKSEITYGGTTGKGEVNYAVKVHETTPIPNTGQAYDPENRQMYTKVGQGKFLEQPFLARTANWPKPLLDMIRREKGLM